MFNYPERIYKYLAYFNYMLKYRNIINGLHEPREHLAKNLFIAIEDAKEYLGISTDDFFECANLWPKKEETLFLSRKGNDTFYKEWKGEYAKYNICANILNQFNDTINFKTIYNYLPGILNNNSVVIDYGCGTATLSIALAIENIIKSKIILLDIDNDIKKFVLFRIDKHNLNRDISVHDVITFSENNICNALYCIDVLEHIEKSSDTLINKIHPMIKQNGILYLKAPWRGQLTHIDSAAIDFYFNGGRHFLREKYTLLSRVQPIDIACLYKKTRSQ